MGIIQPNIVAYYPFESTLPSLGTDVSGNGRDGVVYGVTQGVGKIGGAGVFDGANDYMKLYIATLAQQNSCTWMLWVYPINTNTNEVYIANQGGRAGLAIRQSFLTKGKFQVGYGNTIGGIAFSFESSMNYTINNWYHLAMVIDNAAGNGNAYLYINGVLDNSSVINGIINAPSYPIHVGNYNLLPASSYLEGSLSKLKIFNIALSEQNIRREMIGLNAII